MSGTRKFLSGFRDIFRGGRYESIKPVSSDRLRLSGKNLAVSCTDLSFAVEMGKQTLHICPDLPPGPADDSEIHDFLIYDPELYHAGIAHCLRLKPGKTVSIDHRQEWQRVLFSHPRDAFRRHLQVTHKGHELLFRDPISELGTYLSVLDGEQGGVKLQTARQNRLERLKDIFGGDFRQLDPEPALELLQEVNQLLRSDPFRRLDGEDNPGSLLELPAHITPVIVGDLHGQVDNLLTLLCENSILDELERGNAALVLLGDAVHREQKNQLGEMDSSVLIMDLILKLKQRFPERVFFVLGNHDSFSPEVMKGGVPQSVLWEKKLKEYRGEEYAREMIIFYQLCPLVVLSRDFLACHAGPPRTAINIETLVEARQFPELVHELTWSRLKTRHWPTGYSRAQVKRFRKSLGQEDSLPFIVAHYPQSADKTLWLNAGEIPNHHIVFSARRDRVGLFVRIDDELLPQVYPVRRLGDLAS